ncbi:hypothetical protein FKM82_002266 [Ascaphus truei]
MLHPKNDGAYQSLPLFQRTLRLFALLILYNDTLKLSGVHCWTYHFSTEPMPYEQARIFCQSHYTDLVAIQNKREIEHLEETIPRSPSYYWIGIRKINGVWTWVGTNKILTAEAENWGEGEPNNKRNTEDCVEIYIQRQKDAGKWNDDACTKKKRALCYTASCNETVCSGHGECLETINNYTCSCDEGFYGTQCQYVTKCEVLRAPLNGSIECYNPWADYSYGSACKCGCLEGWVLHGSNVTECGASGQWTNPTPACEATKCDVLGAPHHGSIECYHPWANYSYGSSCMFRCSEGWILHGSSAAECGATGQWTESSPACELVQCEPLEAAEQGSMNCTHPYGNFSFGTVCEFDCNEGWIYNIPNQTMCQASGEWSESIPQCEATKCDVLGAPHHGSIECYHPWANYSYGSSCMFRCSEGWILHGSSAAECEATGQWTESSPACELVQCEPLEAAEQGSMNCTHPYGNFSFGTVCEFDCNEGWIYNIPNQIMCQASGEWSESIPQCEGQLTFQHPLHNHLTAAVIIGGAAVGSVAMLALAIWLIRRRLKNGKRTVRNNSY